MNLYRVYTGYEGNSLIHYLITAETPEYAELRAVVKATADGERIKVPLDVELVFDNVGVSQISEIIGDF